MLSYSLPFLDSACPSYFSTLGSDLPPSSFLGSDLGALSSGSSSNQESSESEPDISFQFCLGLLICDINKCIESKSFIPINVLVPVFLVPEVLALLKLLFLEGDAAAALDVGKGQVNLGVLQFVVLVEAALRPVGLPTHLHRALVVPLDLISIPAHPLALLVFVLALAHELLVLSGEYGTSCFLRRETRWFLSSISSLIWLVSAMLARVSLQF